MIFNQKKINVDKDSINPTITLFCGDTQNVIYMSKHIVHIDMTLLLMGKMVKYMKLTSINIKNIWILVILHVYLFWLKLKRGNC